MAERLNTAVIGGGQAGLSISYYLTQQGREHVVLEKDRPGEAWRSKKWDSFSLVTPNRQMELPDFPYTGDDPEGFMTRDEVVQYIDDFIASFHPPLRLGVEAHSVAEKAPGDGFTVETDAGVLEASNVVVATGTFQKPRVPARALFPRSPLAPHPQVRPLLRDRRGRGPRRGAHRRSRVTPAPRGARLQVPPSLLRAQAG
jgi:putative flavoprotein involved in K+ transport